MGLRYVSGTVGQSTFAYDKLNRVMGLAKALTRYVYPAWADCHLTCALELNNRQVTWNVVVDLGCWPIRNSSRYWRKPAKGAATEAAQVGI